jgi:BlaI family penicillinase repressor
MNERRLDVTDAELAVLQTLWEQGTLTIRHITATLYLEGTAGQYGTVQKLLERLEAKACVGRDRRTWPHRFTAVIDRETLIGWRLHAMAEKLCGGSMAPLLLHLLKTEPFSTDQRQELRSFLDHLQQTPRPKEREGKEPSSP